MCEHLPASGTQAVAGADLPALAARFLALGMARAKTHDRHGIRVLFFTQFTLVHGRPPEGRRSS
eukprot:scaffold32569_cov112-Isochrysis_galbana.AAC.5